MSLIYTKQLDPVSLSAFVLSISSGSAFSGSMVNYVLNSGFMGNNVVTTTGGAQIIIGVKTFASSPIVPYYGSTGAAPSAQWVIDQLASVSGGFTGNVTIGGSQSILGSKTFTLPVTVANPTNSGQAINLGYLTGVSGVLAANAAGAIIKVTGSNSLSTANFTGLGGTLVFTSGSFVFISGAGQAGGGGGGSATGYIVYQTGDQTISGFKIFTGSIWANAPSGPSGLVNALYASGLSGALQAQITGATGYNVYNTYFITGTGTVNLNYTATGSINNTFNDTTNNFVTGNYVNLSAYADQYNLYTGLAFWEAYVGRTFTATGYAVGGQTSGTQGFLSGSFYQRTPTNAKVNFLDFSLNSGLFVYASGGFAQTVTGLNRVGIDIYLIGTGLTGVTFGLFGVGT